MIMIPLDEHFSRLLHRFRVVIALSLFCPTESAKCRGVNPLWRAPMTVRSILMLASHATQAILTSRCSQSNVLNDYSSSPSVEFSCAFQSNTSRRPGNIQIVLVYCTSMAWSNTYVDL